MQLKTILGPYVAESLGPHADKVQRVRLQNAAFPSPASPRVLTEQPFHLQQHFQAQKYRNELSEINCKPNIGVIPKNVTCIVKEVQILTKNENWRFTELLILGGGFIVS